MEENDIIPRVRVILSVYFINQAIPLSRLPRGVTKLVIVIIANRDRGKVWLSGLV